MLEAEVASLKTRLEDHTLLLQHMAQCNDLQSALISHHEVLIYRLMKRLPPPGETSGCREDELRNKGSNDDDNDPSAAKEGEQPTLSTQVGLQT